MRRSLVGTYTIFALLIIIFAVSSFSYSAVSYNRIFKDAVNYLKITVPAYLNNATNLENLIILPAAPDGYGTGLADAVIELHSPEYLPAGETLICDITLSNVAPGLECLLTWYINGEIISEEYVITGTEFQSFKHDFEYSRDMEETAHIKVLLQHIMSNGEVQKITEETSIELENHDMAYWTQQEARRVFDLVSYTYRGNHTLQWALDNDYDAFDKEVWVNASHFESETEYLIWINRSHQRVNIFQGSQGNWELIKEFIVATGDQGRGTHRGVTKIPSRTREGWGFEDRDPPFRVFPVVRFFPGSGFAFHSRPKAMGSNEIIDESIGFPASGGCIRMYDEDIWFIYDNIPDGTTVVIH